MILIALLTALSTTASAPAPATGNDEIAASREFQSPKTRAEVIADMKAAKADGSYRLLHQEFEGQYPQASRAFDGKAKATEMALANTLANNEASGIKAN